MSNSVVKIYRGCEILEGKNFIVDDIADYLSTLKYTYTVSDFQYVKQSQHLTIKVNILQSMLDGNIDFDTNYNYISIKNSSDTMTYYYFIRKKTWISSSGILFDLELDTINTYNNKWSFGNKTKVKREHKDRIIKRDVILNEGFDDSTLEYQDWTDPGPDQLKFGSLSIQLTAPKNVDLQFTFLFGYNPKSYTYSYSKESGIILINMVNDIARTIDVRVLWKNKANKYIRKIDLQSEGITPLLYRNSLNDVDIREIYDDTWYLIYKNRENITTENPSQPIDTYLVPENNVVCTVNQAGVSEINPGDLESGKYHYFDEPGLAIYDVNNDLILETSTTSQSYPRVGIVTVRKSFVIYVNNSKISIQQIENTYAMGHLYKFTKTVSGLDKIIVRGATSSPYYKGSTLTANRDTYSQYSKLTWSFGNSANVELWGINSWDKTDTKLLKIIKLPYVPLNIKVDSTTSNIIVDGSKDWLFDIDTHSIKLYNSLKYFNKNINSKNMYNPYSELLLTDLTVDKDADRNDKYESKLLHSDYYYNKLVYDSFGFNFTLENLNIDDSIFAETMNINFVVSSAISGRFMFRFPDYVLNHTTSDYSNILTVARNNEVAIYTSPYLEYLRNGYNYDVKNKNLSRINNIASTLTSVGGGALMGAITGGGPAGLIAGTGLGLVKGAISGIVSDISAQNSIEQKLNQTKNQAVTVSESDDVELMTAYCGNRAKFVKYECSDEIKEQLANLFYYYGYISNKTGIPNINSRYWFNFIQCELDIERPYNMTDDMYNTLINKFNDGVTYIHVHRDLAGQNPKWDIKQIKENWENSIM